MTTGIVWRPLAYPAFRVSPSKLQNRPAFVQPGIPGGQVVPHLACDEKIDADMFPAPLSHPFRHGRVIEKLAYAERRSFRRVDEKPRVAMYDLDRDAAHG